MNATTQAWFVLANDDPFQERDVGFNVDFNESLDIME